MSNYTKSTDFAAKDALSSGDPLKVIKGSEIGAEYDNIQTAVNSKLDAANGTSTGTLTLGGAINYPAEASIASSGTTSIGSAASNNVLVTGTTTITSFGTIAAGVCRMVRFSGILTLTYNSTSLILPGLSSITTAVNDCLEAESLGSGNWIVRSYTRADGGATFAGQIQPVTASTASNALTINLAPTFLEFRSATLTTGASTRISTGSLSITVQSTSNLGAILTAQVNRLVVLVANNAGTPVLCVANLYTNATSVNFDESSLINPTTIGAASNTAGVIYSNSAVGANIAFRVVGFVDATFTTGTGWTSITEVQGEGGNALTALSSIGYGQAWQDVTGTRAINTTYYNTTGKPIQVGITPNNPAGVGVNLKVNGATIALSQSNGAVGNIPFFAIIPPGASYSVPSAGGVTINIWWELR